MHVFRVLFAVELIQSLFEVVLDGLNVVVGFFFYFFYSVVEVRREIEQVVGRELL